MRIWLTGHFVNRSIGRARPGRLVCAGWALLAWLPLVVSGQSPNADSPFVAVGSQPREFAPGVVHTIAPDMEPEDTVTTHDLIEIRQAAELEWAPAELSPSRTLFNKAEGVKLRRNVWCLEFSFKPLRMIRVDIPQLDGETQNTLVWYMVYHVENTGVSLEPQVTSDGTYSTQSGQSPAIRFVPQFVLESKDRDPSGQPIYKAYLDRILPVAVTAIRERETPNRELLNSVQMAQQLLEPSSGRLQGGVWGVATWERVDPRIDFLAVYVSGLTNAYRWVDTPGGYQAGDPPGKGRQFLRRTLQLNFWRPGDEYQENEREIRFGVPPGKSFLFDVPAGVTHRWVFR